jgi:hypothetical protein
MATTPPPRPTYLHPPLMLDDLTRNIQRLSARLSPDITSRFYLRREDSGILSLLQADETNSEPDSPRTSREAGRGREGNDNETEDDELLAPVNDDGREEVADEPLRQRRSFWTRIWCCRRRRSPQNTTLANRSKPMSLYQHIKARIRSIWIFCKLKGNKNDRNSG